MSPPDDGIDWRPIAGLNAELMKWCEEQALPLRSAEELVHEDVTPEQRRYLHDFIARRETLLLRKPVPETTTYRLDLVVAEFVRLFRDAGIDCTAARKAKIKEAVFSLVCVLSASEPYDRNGINAIADELNAISNDAEALVERLDRAGDMGICDDLLAKAQYALSDVAAQARRNVGAHEPRRGRPRKLLAARVALITIEMFEEITGFKAGTSNPSKPRVLEPLVRNAFSILGIDGNPTAAVNAALGERHRS
jgi:hypothetical protein